MMKDERTDFLRRWASRNLALLLLGGLLTPACAGPKEPARAPQGSPPPEQERRASEPTPAPTLKENAEDAEEQASPSSAGAPIAPRAAPKKQRSPARVEALALPKDEFERLSVELSDALNRVDCAAAGKHRDAICELSKKICEISSELPGSQESNGRCEDGKQRCEAAKARFKGRCG